MAALGQTLAAICERMTLFMVCYFSKGKSMQENMLRLFHNFPQRSYILFVLFIFWSLPFGMKEKFAHTYANSGCK